MPKKPPAKCQRCGGELKLAAGLRVCTQCGHAANMHKDFDKSHDVPRDSGWKAKIIRDDD